MPHGVHAAGTHGSALPMGGCYPTRLRHFLGLMRTEECRYCEFARRVNTRFSGTVIWYPIAAVGSSILSMWKTLVFKVKVKGSY
jgi:hypothetical protein